MQDLETLRYEESGGVGTIRLHRPPDNWVNVQMLHELGRVFDRIEDERPVRAIVLRGSGGVFTRGIDFADFHPDRPLDIHGFNRWEKLCVRFERLPVPTIVAVDGPAIGAGFQLLLLGDLRVATPAARFQLPEVKLGFLPGMATWRLARFVGLGRARRIVLTGEEIDADQALELGLVDRVLPTADEGVAWALEALGPGHPVAVELARRLLIESASNSFEDAIGHFLAAQHRAISQSAFLDTLKKHRG